MKYTNKLNLDIPQNKSPLSSIDSDLHKYIECLDTTITKFGLQIDYFEIKKSIVD